MQHDGRLVRMIHVLIHMALLGGRESSVTIARMLGTHPVVVRRTMGALRRGGLVQSEGGRGGGWSLCRPLDAITVLDIKVALGIDTLLPESRSNDHPHCPVERASNAALADAYASAESVLATEFAKLRLSDIAASIPSERAV